MHSATTREEKLSLFLTVKPFCRVFGTGTKEALPLADFLTAVGHLKFRGTSVLFRLPLSVMTNIKKQV